MKNTHLSEDEHFIIQNENEHFEIQVTAIFKSYQLDCLSKRNNKPNTVSIYLTHPKKKLSVNQ